MGLFCRHRNFFPDHNVVAEANSQADQEAQRDLSGQFHLRMEAFLVVFEHLDVVIRETDRPAPEGRE